ARAIAHCQGVDTRAARQIADTHCAPRLARGKLRGDQIEIGDAVDLVVIGDTRGAVAEADLRPHIELDAAGLAAASLATERSPGGPAVARKRPRYLAPCHGPTPWRGEMHHRDRRECGDH